MAPKSQVLQISGMTCQSCASRMEQSVKSMTGVKKASVDFFQNILKVEFDQTILSLKQIISAIMSVGYLAVEQTEFYSSEAKGVTAISPVELKHQLVILPIVFGITGVVTVSGLYITILSILNSFDYAWAQLLFLGRWMIPLLAGFGIQVGLFSYLRRFARLAKSGQLSGVPVVTSAGISTGSMIACCLHHVVDVLPILGLSAVAIFVSQFQSFLLAVGVVSNLTGISYMLYNIQKHRLFLNDGILAKLQWSNMKLTLYFAISLGLIWLTYLFYLQF